MRRRVAGVALLSALTIGCTRPPAAEVRVDGAELCERVDVRFIDDPLTPGSFARALVGDRHDATADEASDLGWVITSDDNDDLLLRLGIPASPIPLNTPPGTEYDLVAGAFPGESWLLLDGPGLLEIWRLDESGTPQQGEPLADFPTGPGDEFARALLFVGRQPYLFATRRASEGTALEFWLSAIDEDLRVGDPWRFDFGSTCTVDPQICELTFLSRVRVLDVAEADGRSPGHVLLGVREDVSEDVGEFNPRSLYAATVSFSLDETTQEPIAVLRTNFPLLGWEFSADYDARIAPASLAADDTGFYILAGLEVVDLDTPTGDPIDLQVVRYSAANGLSVRFGALAAEYSPHLLQTEATTALGWFVDDVWTIAPMREASFEPDRYSDFELPTTMSRAIYSGGRGDYLMRIDGTEAARVGLSCDPFAGDDADPEPRARGVDARSIERVELPTTIRTSYPSR